MIESNVTTDLPLEPKIALYASDIGKLVTLAVFNPIIEITLIIT